MREEQKLMTITLADLLPQVKAYYDAGYRLAQIGATKTAGFELNYSFDKNYELVNLRVILASPETPVPSISKIYWNAFLYENEINDLFGLKIENIAVDYQGKFYRTAIKAYFGEPK